MCSRSSLPAAVLPLLLVPRLTLAAHCIADGDEREINAALSGTGARALLCQHARFRLAHAVVLTADGQELATIDSPPQDAQARLEIADPELATAVFSRASQISVHHLIIDGARPRLGRIPGGGALIELGGNVSGVSVNHLRAFDPRGWSVLHVFEGDGRCTGARILSNDIGPAGHPNGEWADGVSFACKSGLIDHNRITDASDGGIVIFGAPGTVVSNNIIRTRTNTLLGGINLVDFKPSHGDYTGTIVKGNRIEALGGYIKIAIAAGPAVWGDRDPSHINRGALILGNAITGGDLGFGIAVDGVTDFIVSGNTAHAHFTGSRSQRCWPHTTGPGYAFIRNLQTSTGAFQQQFASGSLGYAICAER